MNDTVHWHWKSKGPGHQNSLDTFQNLPYKDDFSVLQVEECEFLKALDKRCQAEKSNEFGLEWKNEI